MYCFCFRSRVAVVTNTITNLRAAFLQLTPLSAVVGEAFNRQPDGSAGFWLHIGCAPKSAVMVLDGVELPTTVRSDMMITARVEHFASLERGQYPLVLLDRASGEKLPIGSLAVQ